MATTSPPRLAYVEDNDALRYATSRILREGGFAVQEADTGAEGLRIARAIPPPDLVLLDVRLPDISGFEVCRRIKSDPQTAGIPVLHLSHTYAAGDWVAQGLEGGADGYLIQPTEPRVLLATIHSLLRARTAETKLRETNRRLQDVLAEREELLRREAEARRDAEEANVLKDQFLATLSHELRTPLNAIVGWIHVLRTAPDDEALRGRAIDVIARNSRMQARLIEEILDVSRIVSGKLALNLREVDWMQVLEGAVEAVRPAAEAKGLQLELVAEHVPAGVEGDPVRLQQVVSNLLGNAVKFSGGGRVELRLGVDGEHVRLAVSDEGGGIPEAFLPHVFERFRQADSSASRTQPGLGLGLTIVRHIVEMHGGSVRAENRGDRRGARFTVLLPLRAAPVRPAAAAPARASATRDALAGRQVLIVDDDEDGLTLVETVLARHQARVTRARSADEARAALLASPPDVIVCDIGMPGEHGLDFVQWVRQQPHLERLPVVALTAYAGEGDREKGLSAGFDAYVTKPVEVDALIVRLAEVLAAGPAGAGPVQ
jgi:signal transduction histidine kinase